MEDVNNERDTLLMHQMKLVNIQQQTYEALIKTLKENPKVIYSGKSSIKQYERLLNIQDSTLNNLIKSQARVLETQDENLGKIIKKQASN